MATWRQHHRTQVHHGKAHVMALGHGTFRQCCFECSCVTHSTFVHYNGKFMGLSVYISDSLDVMLG